jgi:hypothetical protein
MEYKKLSEKLPAKLDDIFEPIIKIKIGANEIVVLCDPSANVSVIFKTSFDRLNLGYLMVTELKLHLADSTFKQAVCTKENTGVQIKDCPALINLVIGYMPQDPIALIILGWPFLRIVKALINLHEGNVRFELPSHTPFIVHFPKTNNKANGRSDDLETELVRGWSPHNKEELIFI